MNKLGYTLLGSEPSYIGRLFRLRCSRLKAASEAMLDTRKTAGKRGKLMSPVASLTEFWVSIVITGFNRGHPICSNSDFIIKDRIRYPWVM